MNARPARSTSREVLATGPYPVGTENVDRGRGCAWGAQTRPAYRSVDLQEDRISAPHARRPVRRVRRLLLERLHDHPLDVLVADRARLARPRLIVQPVEATPREPSPPLADRRTGSAQLGRDLRARPTVSRRQHNPAAKRQRLRALRTPSPPLQRLPLLIVEHDLSTNRHDRPQSSLIRTTFDTSTPGPCELTTQITRRSRRSTPAFPSAGARHGASGPAGRAVRGCVSGADEALRDRV